MVARVCKPSTGEGEAGDLWSSPANSVTSMVGVGSRFSERAWLKKIRWKVLEEEFYLGVAF